MLLDLFFASPVARGVAVGRALYLRPAVHDGLRTALPAERARSRRVRGQLRDYAVYQKDVDRLRRFSPRFLLAMAATCCVQALLWWLTIGAAMGGFGVFMPDGYLFGLGAMVLVQLTVHVRHLRNYILFRAIAAADGISGRIRVPASNHAETLVGGTARVRGRLRRCLRVHRELVRPRRCLRVRRAVAQSPPAVA